MKKGYKVGPEHPCSICGLPTRSALSVCSRDGECRKENNRLFHAAVRDPDRRQTIRPCSVCGEPTTSKIGVCQRPGKCRAESDRLSRAAKRGQDTPPVHPCSICGQPTTSRFPTCCRRGGKCKTEYNRLSAEASRPPGRGGQGPSHPCSVCGLPTSAESGICTRQGECRAASKRLAWAAKPRAAKPRVAKPRVAKIGKAAASSHPCSICGLPTTSKFPMCSREGECRRERSLLRPKRKTRDPARRRITQPCSMCGQPTSSNSGICSRPGECRVENTRLRRPVWYGKDAPPSHPCSICGEPTTAQFPMCTRLHLDNQKTAGSVYAVWFPYPRILKVGFTTHTSYAVFVNAARGRAKRRGWETSDCRCIWNQPGDVRTEAFMQSTLAFRWPPVIGGESRLSEWFRVPGLPEAKMVKVLDEIYGMVPADTTADVPASLF